MDYVVGSVAALISGNVTPNRPKNLKRALTPVKHQPSPNVTPKSEYVEDRSIFLSPTTQKKKAIVKKSPKRIFQNADLDMSNDGELNNSSPKTDKVKKHLKNDLDFENVSLHVVLSPKSAKTTNMINSPEKLQQEVNNEANRKKKKNVLSENNSDDMKVDTQRTESEEKNKRSNKNKDDLEPNCDNTVNSTINKKKKKKKSLENNLLQDVENEEENSTPSMDLNADEANHDVTKKKKKKQKFKTDSNNQLHEFNQREISKGNSDSKDLESSEIYLSTVSKKKKKKGKVNIENTDCEIKQLEENKTTKKKRKKYIANLESNNLAPDSTKISNVNKKSKHQKSNEESYDVNPNAITNKDTDSEHESDDEMPSENEEIDKKAYEADPSESSDGELEEIEKIDKDIVQKKETDDEVKRTLFVGNVPLSKKCKKEIKKIFSEYGRIETVRIRTVPVKDARMTPKMAVIKNELHPDRSTVNIYIRYADAASVDKALSANNMVLNDHHLRVSKSDVTGVFHDPKCSVFVGNLPFALEDEALRAKFERCGEIHSVRIIRDKKTNAGKGFGYVNFTSKDSVELALALTEEDLTIKNRILRVKRCTQTNKQQTQRQGNNQSNQGRHTKHNLNQTDSNMMKNEGAYRRLMNKRKNMDGPGGPPNKKQRDLNQPHKEKKNRKEFVGMTAEKKKKQKFSKGQKKKKALSEILMKK